MSNRTNTTTDQAATTAAWRWYLLDDNQNEWEWGKRARRRHDLSTWLPVDVPTSVQEALWHARRIPHPYRDLNTRAAEWVEHRDWVYGCDFVLPPPPEGRRVFLTFDAVADACRVFVNGTLVGEHEGPGAPFTLEIGPDLQEPDNQLLVVIQAPRPEDPQIGWTDRTRSLQGRMGYGWDFAPRLVRLGILGPVRLHTTGATRLHDLWVRGGPDARGTTATLRCQVGMEGPPGVQVRFAVYRGQREVAHSEPQAAHDGWAAATLTVPDPDLWWPNGMGDQPLYTVRAECVDGSDMAETSYGIRDLRWAGRPGGPPEEWPFTLVVNGQRVFQRGWNWVPADCMGGPLADRQARRLLTLARDAGVNILRCWGGGDPETPAFYETCDRLGLLVWQEFPTSSAGISNMPPDDPAYLARLAAYARDVIAARRNHPSLAVWGGGNELRGRDDRPLTLDHPYAARLAAVAAAEDPDRMFRPSSPLGPVFEADPEQGPQWDVHGAWEYSGRWPGPQYWRLNAVRPLLHSELGLPGEAALATQQRWLSPAHRDRADTNPARQHHGGAWWKHADTVAKVFGPIDDPAQAILASQWLQAEGLRYYIEETRRRWPDTAGIFPWQLNEPWPNVTCTSAVEYGGRPKLGYYAVRAAYRPLVISAHYTGFRVDPGGPLKTALWALNDGPAFDAELTVSLHDLAGHELHAPIRQAVTVPAQASTQLLDLEVPLPESFSGLLVLDLALGDVRNRYLFSNQPEHPLRAALAVPDLLIGMFPDAPPP
jgi:beta-mannosidase